MEPESENLIRRINGWARQNRFRAIRYGCVIDITPQRVVDTYQLFSGNCGYCQGTAENLDFIFPIKNGGPCVPANIIPCCEKCRINKKGRDIFLFHLDGYISEDRMRALLVNAISRDCGAILKTHMKRLYKE